MLLPSTLLAFQAAGAEAVHQAPQVGEAIIEHISNSPLAEPVLRLPTVFGVNLSVTKHVLMLWIVAATIFAVVTVLVRRYVSQARLVPAGPMNTLEIGVE